MSASWPGHWSTRWKRNLAGGNNQGGASWLHGMYLAHRYSTCGGLRWFDLSIHMAGSRKSMEIPHPWAHPPHLRWFKIVARLERHTHFATALRSLDLRHSFYQYLSQNNYENLIKSPYKTQQCAAILKQCVAGGEPSCFRIFHHSGASFTTQVEDVFLMTLDDLDDEEKDRLWVSWRLCWNMLEQMAKVF